MSLPDGFHRRLGLALRRNGISKNAFIAKADSARIAGGARATVYRLFRGDGEPTADLALFAADLTGVSLRWLLTGEENVTEEQDDTPDVGPDASSLAVAGFARLLVAAYPGLNPALDEEWVLHCAAFAVMKVAGVKGVEFYTNTLAPNEVERIRTAGEKVASGIAGLIEAVFGARAIELAGPDACGSFLVTTCTAIENLASAALRSGWLPPGPASVSNAEGTD